MSLDTAFPQQPGTRGSIPLTRRQLRERERATENESTQPRTRQSVEAPTVAVVAELFMPTAESTAIVPPARKPRRSAAKSKRIRVSPAAFSASGPPRRPGKALASKALSSVAMLFAAALLVGVSVPSNAFVSSDNVMAITAAPAAEFPELAADSRPTQSLAVSDEVVGGVDRRDGVKVVSSAEVLALKFAGIDYQYNATAGPIRWPFPYAVPTTDKFGDRIGGFHKGTDFAAPSGAPIYAIADGVVTYVQADNSGYGYYVRISHVIDGQQVESLYAHMTSDSSPLVVGDEVKVGDFIGLVGDTGRSFGPHLHLEIHLDEVPVDSFTWLTAKATN